MSGSWWEWGLCLPVSGSNEDTKLRILKRLSQARLRSMASCSKGTSGQLKKSGNEVNQRTLSKVLKAMTRRDKCLRTRASNSKYYKPTHATAEATKTVKMHILRNCTFTFQSLGLVGTFSMGSNVRSSEATLLNSYCLKGIYHVVPRSTAYNLPTRTLYTMDG